MDAIETYRGFPTVTAGSRASWRKWLVANHDKVSSIWLIIYKKDSGIGSVTYNEAVDEGLCFGWIDSKPNKRDDKSYYQFFSKRSPKSNWSKVNKLKVEHLIQENLMTEAGYQMISIARENGTWDALNDVDNLILPDDLRSRFDRNPTAFKHWKNFPDSVKRGILEWIFNAKREETRLKRITQTVDLAQQNIRTNQYHG